MSLFTAWCCCRLKYSFGLLSSCCGGGGGSLEVVSSGGGVIGKSNMLVSLESRRVSRCCSFCAAAIACTMYCLSSLVGGSVACLSLSLLSVLASIAEVGFGVWHLSQCVASGGR